MEKTICPTRITATICVVTANGVTKLWGPVKSDEKFSIVAGSGR